MRILIIEDDKKIAGFIKKGLEEEYYSVDVFGNGADGLYWAKTNDYDLILLDLMLPGKDGIAICRELRRSNVITPILMLTAKDTLEDKIAGLDEGADDYLTKPFSFEELLSRVRALLRRNQKYKTKALKAGDLELDISSRIAVRGGKKIELSGKEYALLEYLLRNRGKVLTETMIIEHVWDMNFESMTNVVNVYIHHLRQKIDKGFDTKLLHTIRGSGYVLRDEGADE